MRRKILIAFAALLTLLLLFVVGVFWYIRSGRLDNFLRNQIIAALEESGTKATIGKTTLDLRGYKVTLEDIRLETEKDGKPYGSIGKLIVSFSVLDYLKQKISINEVIIERPNLYIEFDEKGRLNLESLRAPERKQEDKGDALRFADATVTLTDGELNLIDKFRNLTINLRNLSVELKPEGEATIANAIHHALTLNFANSSAVFEGKPIDNLKAHLAAKIIKDGETEQAGISKLDVTSDIGSLNASGQLTDFSPFKYELNLLADLPLAKLAQIFAPDLKLDGNARFDGRVNGAAADYRVVGKVESSALAAEGIRITGVRVNTDLTGKGDEYRATADATSGKVSGKGVSLGSIVFKDANLQGKGADFDVTGGLALASLKSGAITVNGFRARLDVNNDRANLSQITASALGGSITGQASLAYSGNGASNVDVQFKSIDLNQAATLASAKDVTVRGTANGVAHVKFPGLNFNALTGRIESAFDATVSPPDLTTETLPASGEAVILATGRGFIIEKLEARSPQSQLIANGTSDLKGNATLDVNFKSEELAEVQRIVDAFGFIPQKVKDEYGVAVSGPGEFTGRVVGQLSAPRVTGHLKLASIATHKDPDDESSTGEVFGAFEGDLRYTPDLLTIENGSVVRADNSRADFTLTAPLKDENAIAVKAAVRNFNLAAIINLAVPRFKDVIERGAINGTIDLRGLPGSRTIAGTADISLTAAEFNLPAAEDGQEAKKVSVPEFVGQVRIDNSVLTVNDMRMQVGETLIAGEGRFNLDTYQYSINAEGRGIDLAELSKAASDSVQLAGRADLTIKGDGIWKEWADINVQADVQGQNVTLNGRSLGDAKLKLFTDNGLLRIEATGDILDSPRTFLATVDLRDRENYPISARIELNNEDLAPYLQLIAPNLAKLTGRATGTIVFSGPLQDTDRLQAVVNLSKLEIGGNIAEGQTYKLSNQGDIVLTATPREVKLESVTFTGEGTSVNIGGLISREEALTSNLAINGEVNLRLLSSFTEAVNVSGIAKIQAAITGALDAPRFVGFAELKDIGASVDTFPLSVARGNGILRFTANQAVLENFVAAAPGGGRVRLTGGAALANLVPERWLIEAKAEQVEVEYPRDTQVLFDASLALQGNDRFQLLSGKVDVRRASYTKEILIDDLLTGNLPFTEDSLYAGSGGGGGVSSSRTNLDIKVTANETLSIQNNLADAQGSAFITVRGTMDNPVAAGRITLSRGTLEFRNDRYEITRGVISLPPGRVTEPILDISAETEIKGYKITIAFRDTLAKLKTSLRSEPSLPEADIISLVLTGTIAESASSQTQYVKQTGLGLAQSLIGARISETTSKTANRLFGLSRLSVDPLVVGRNNDPTARVTLSQRVTKDLSITYAQNLSSSGPSGVDRVILVEYRLSNRFSVVGFKNERSDIGFEVRLRKRF